jgi:1-acyl-sn-glycerol-3-phosphate acyltransferase
MSPEGTRSRTGALIQAKTGTAYIAARANVTLQPLALTGTEKVFPALKRLRRARVTVTFGPPFNLPPRGERPRREHLGYCTELIMARLASMLPPAYRGYYADSPLIAYWEQLDADGLSSKPEWIDVPGLDLA